MSRVFLYDGRLLDPALIDSFKDFFFTAQPVNKCSVLLRWGNISGSDNTAEIVLNRKVPLMSCLDKEKMLHILQLNRIRRPRLVVPRPESRYPLIAKYVDPDLGFLKEKIVTDMAEAQKAEASFFVECINTVQKFNVYLFDMKVILLTKKLAVKTNSKSAAINPLWHYEEIPADLNQETQKVTLLAQRAVHVLGLDFAMVHAGIDVNGRSVILDVSPAPPMPPQALTKFIQEVHKYIKYWAAVHNQRRNQPVTAVPQKESGFIQTALVTGSPAQTRTDNPAQTGAGSPVKTSGVKTLEVILGADPEFMLRNVTTGALIYPSDFLPREGALGYDQRSERREGVLFPLAEIRPAPDPCPLKLTEKIREILVKAAAIIPANVEWLAGSLHFEQYQIGGHIHFSNCEINSALLRALDNYLALPVMLVEDSRNSIRRRKQYGWLGSIRTKPHGGFEYRTPGSWLVSPEYTRGCLCLAKIVATDYQYLTRDCLTDPELQKAFYQSKKYYFYDIFDELWQDIRQTPHYQLYADYLAPLVELIRSRSHWNENIDLRKSWGLVS